jgi:glutamate dehydrogenase
MSYKFEEGKDAIIEAVIAKSQHLKNEVVHEFFVDFVHQFYGTVALEDLQAWTVDDLYAAAANFISLIHHRAPGEIKTRIYNPNFELHGWQTTHTVIEVISNEMPFLVDSIRMVLNRMHITPYLIIHLGGLRIERDKNHDILHIHQGKSRKSDETNEETAILIEIECQTDHNILEALQRNLEKTLDDNRLVTEDWESMRTKVRELIEELNNAPSTLEKNEIEETQFFLKWIEDHHFTFLGIRDYELVENQGETILQAIPHTSLGVLKRESGKANPRTISTMPPEARGLLLSSHILVMSKTNTEATVHRNAFTDYIGVKRFNKEGQVTGERRIIGLYTSAAYNTNPKHIPFLRHKVEQIVKNSKLNPKGHAGRVLQNIIDTLPRDDLIQGSEEEILELAMGIYYMQERRRIRLFTRVDVYRRFISCLVYVPKDIFTTELRRTLQNVLCERLHGKSIAFSTYFSESILARIHYIIRINTDEQVSYDFKDIERELIEVARSWNDDFQSSLEDGFGEEKGNHLFVKYKNAFQTGYTSNFSAKTALFDIKHIEQLTDKNPLGMNFYKPLDEYSEYYRLKIYRHDHTIPLSDVLPILENMGLRAITERPYVLTQADGKETWINDFTLQYTGEIEFNLDEIRELFQKSFTRFWFGDAENDGFNKLVISAGLDWRQVAVLRTYAKYFKQIGFTFSQDYMESALCNNALIAKKLDKLFQVRFQPNPIKDRDASYNSLVAEIFSDLDKVDNLDEDKIIRQFVHAISATTRTNFYQELEGNASKNTISIKLNSKAIPGVPRPCPMVEIFVYSPTFEGVHLRCGKVARGGIRWSDRREDFRTEILGLMKAQQVKNSVIVPSGAKGGFVLKQLPTDGSRESIQAEGIRCYQQFIRALLDLTDNYEEGVISKPNAVLCYDEDDPYLVVAADKGTATFSDIANEISKEYGFWLGDAFASGGSVGYDHKKMGITAKGAWESVKRHFYELNINISNTDFTVVGIGDMAGDVFGNGMLLSKHIKLVAAFNHMHVFIDPDPSAEASYFERERLFNLPRSTWADYDAKLISRGGGVFNRNAKSVPVSPEMKSLFDITQDFIEPNELIRQVLKAKIDLIWSGGIGTFVKAEHQSNLDVGDRYNDGIRVNACDLRCKAVGEGGNLGFTQLARVEYAMNGGHIYTDFIDNSGGVSCSDKEVNIKILLNQIVDAGDMTEKQRNALLFEMTDEVSQLVLRENYLQPRSISLTQTQAARIIELHRRYMNELERIGKLDREIEYLPDEKLMNERKSSGAALTAPEISVLICYSKIILKELVLASDVPEEPFLNSLLINAFPKPLQNNYAAQMQQHPLRREIITTQLCNMIVDETGFSFVYRLQDETGASVPAIVRAYMIARTVLNMEPIWKQIEALDAQVSVEQQHHILMTYVRLIRRVTRWFLRNNRTRIDMDEAVKIYAQGVVELKNSMPNILSEGNRKLYDQLFDEFSKQDIPTSLAHELTITRGLFAAMDIIEVAHELKVAVNEVAKIYFGIGDYLDLNWIRTQVIIHPTDSHWEALSREALRDDLDWQQRLLTDGVIRINGDRVQLMERFVSWSKKHEGLIERWRTVLVKLRSAPVLNYTMFFVAIRELLDLTQTTMQESNELTKK